MAADGLMIQEARASAAIALTWLSQNILVSAPKELNHVQVTYGTEEGQ